jgi:hypothetical protein
VPRRKSVAQVAALAAAVMVAIELTADHWFYLYIVWFAPLVLVASFLPLDTAGRSPAPLGPGRGHAVDPPEREPGAVDHVVA